MNRRAPEFNLQDQDGVGHKLADYAGSWLVIFFYPADNTINCTREVCAFRDENAIISQFGNAQVVGINQGSIASHKGFSDANHLNFPLLSDPDGKVAKEFGAWGSKKIGRLGRLLWQSRRNTYIIDPDGQIVHEFLHVKVDNHVVEVINTLQSLQNLVTTS